jgi:hypothetical protein
VDPNKIDGVIRHLKAALELLERSRAAGGRNAEWFRESGQLSDKGVEHITSLFLQRKTSYAIAKEMHMSYRAVSQRHDAWRKKNPTAAPWMRQDGK